MALSYNVNSLTGTQIAAENVAYTEDVVQQYISNQSGPLSTIGGGEATGTCTYCFTFYIYQVALAEETFPQRSKSSRSNSVKISATLPEPSRIPSSPTGLKRNTFPLFIVHSPATSPRRITTC